MMHFNVYNMENNGVSEVIGMINKNDNNTYGYYPTREARWKSHFQPGRQSAAPMAYLRRREAPISYQGGGV